MTPAVFKKRTPIRLTELIDSQMSAKYPGLEDSKLHNFISRFNLPIPILSVITVAIFVVFWGSNEFLTSRGIVFDTYTLDAESASDILISYLGYLAILIGIVIPVVLLIVPYVEGVRLGSVMDIYLDRIGVKKAMVLAVAMLALESIAIWVVRAHFVPDVKPLFYLTLILMLLNLSVLLETTLVIKRVIRMLSTRSLVNALLTKLTLEAKKSQHGEIRYRLN
jgi:hypothetical protein